MRNVNTKGAKFICNVWGPEGNYVTEKRGFTTQDGAERFAERESGRPGIIEVSVTVKDKAAGPGRVRRIKVYRKGAET